jgi:hypothetical protein
MRLCENLRIRFFPGEEAVGDPFLALLGKPSYRSPGQRAAIRTALTMPPGSDHAELAVQFRGELVGVAHDDDAAGRIDVSISNVGRHGTRAARIVSPLSLPKIISAHSDGAVRRELAW